MNVGKSVATRVGKQVMKSFDEVRVRTVKGYLLGRIYRVLQAPPHTAQAVWSAVTYPLFKRQVRRWL